MQPLRTAPKKMKNHRLTAALSALAIAATGAVFAQGPAAPAPPPPAVPGLDLSKLVTPENLAALSQLLKEDQGDAAAPDLGGMLRSLGKNPELQNLLTPENLAALRALLPPAPSGAPAAPAPPPDLGGMLRSLGENPEIQKLINPETMAAMGAMLEPMLKDLNLEEMLRALQTSPDCPLFKCKVTFEGPDGVISKFNGEDLRRLLQGHRHGGHHHRMRGTPAQPAPAPQATPAPEAARKARIEALIEQLRQELLK